MNLATSRRKRKFDVIVIGSGATGGWAAKEFCDHKLKTLVLERGRAVTHVKDYPTASKPPWAFEFRDTVPIEKRVGFGGSKYLRESTLPFRMKEDEQPFIQEKPFRWYRGYHEGGKSLLWARQTQRWSDYDFEGPERDGFAVDWPIRYAHLAHWYRHVEQFIGIAGSKDGLAVLPDSEVQAPFELSCIEQHFQQSLKKNYENRHLIHGRCAHLTDPQPIHLEQGRAKCVHQRMCNRGCNYGGYFSSNSSTLPWAKKTGFLTFRPHSVVHSIIYSEKKQRAIGVRIIDAITMETIEYFAKVIFVNASTLNSNAILLNSKSNRFPAGLGNDSGLLGKFIAWHNYRGRASASFDGFQNKKTSGKHPSHAYIPRFRNVFKQQTDFLRGYAIGIAGGRRFEPDSTSIGHGLTESLLNPTLGPWRISSWMMGEVIPIKENHVRLSQDQVDKYGIPKLIVSCDWSDNDDKMVTDYLDQSEEMFLGAGFKDISSQDTHAPPGSDIHEMGGIRMGKNPATSLLNATNQLHACKNVFVTDGACMTSTGTQNPTLTFMALTARAANHAIDQLRRKEL